MLKKISGIRTTFIAKVGKFKNANPKNVYVLLSDIRDSQGNRSGFGFWIKVGVQFRRLGLNKNDYIKFRARVNGKGSAYPHEGQYSKFFRLSRPTQILVLTPDHPDYPKDPPKEESHYKDLEEKIAILEWI
jgi:hypothetical protein